MLKQTKEQCRRVLDHLSRLAEGEEVKEAVKTLNHLITDAYKEGQSEKRRIDERIAALKRADEEEIARRVKELEVRVISANEKMKQDALGRLEAHKARLDSEMEEVGKQLTTFLEQVSKGAKKKELLALESLTVVAIGDFTDVNPVELAMRGFGETLITRAPIVEVDGYYVVGFNGRNMTGLCVFDADQYKHIHSVVDKYKTFKDFNKTKTLRLDMGE
jgi:hypothetical protein